MNIEAEKQSLLGELNSIESRKEMFNKLHDWHEAYGYSSDDRYALLVLMACDKFDSPPPVWAVNVLQTAIFLWMHDKNSTFDDVLLKRIF